MESMSQASQDLFYLHMLHYKKDGTFVEIGSNHPITHNNTYIAESKYNWHGIMVEYDSSFEPLYNAHRQNSIHIINDACKVDYRAILDSNGFPTDIDYLQIDLDVNTRSTLDVLELFDRTVFDTYRFATVTFEHDIYTGNHFDTRRKSREILEKRGYKLVFPDVSVFWDGSNKPFEDWYVHPSLVPNYKSSDTSLSHTSIIEFLQQ